MSTESHVGAERVEARARRIVEEFLEASWHNAAAGNVTPIDLRSAAYQSVADVRHAALGLPVARDQTDGGRDDEEDEERDDDERDDADAVAAKASRCRRPDAGRAARRCRCRNRRPHHRAHDSTTRGSTSL